MTALTRITDTATLMAWRAEVLRSVFGTAPDDEVLAANRRFFQKHIGDGTHIAYVATCDGRDAGCAAICLYDEMPSPDNPRGRCGYIMNVYERPEVRHKGIATELLARLIADGEAQGCGKIYLETTDMGRGVYTAIGFREMKNMLTYGN